jgi:uncharacterized protein YkwD
VTAHPRTLTAGASTAAAALLVSLLLVVTTPPAPAEAVVPASVRVGAQAAVRVPSGTYERRLHHWTNVARRRHELRAVRGNACADRYAERWTRRLARTGTLVHRDRRQLLRGCAASTAGEVLATGRVSPRRMVRMWLRSPGHRAILLSPRFRLIGIGARRLPGGSWIATQNYLRR